MQLRDYMMAIDHTVTLTDTPKELYDTLMGMGLVGLTAFCDLDELVNSLSHVAKVHVAMYWFRNHGEKTKEIGFTEAKNFITKEGNMTHLKGALAMLALISNKRRNDKRKEEEEARKKAEQEAAAALSDSSGEVNAE